MCPKTTATTQTQTHTCSGTGDRDSSKPGVPGAKMNPTACGVFMACFELSCRCQLSFRAHELIMQQCSNTSTCCNNYNYNNCSKNKSKWSSDRYPCKIDGCTGSWDLMRAAAKGN